MLCPKEKAHNWHRELNKNKINENETTQEYLDYGIFLLDDMHKTGRSSRETND